MNREEHIEWCKERALKHCDKGMPLAAWIAFKHDMSKHDETRNHVALDLGDQICSFFLQSPETIGAMELLNLPGKMSMRNFIKGFN